jgi:hypothetical protein
MAGSVRAGDPETIVTGGGDDPGIAVVESAADRAITDWKLAEAARLRAAARAALGDSALRPGSRREPGRQGPQPAYLAPPCSDCPPSGYLLESFARQQNTWYFCGPATAQVIVNRTRGFYFTDQDGQDTASNYRKQSAIASTMGTDTDGSTAWMVKRGLNQYADLGASGRTVEFTVLDGISSGSDFGWAMVLATYYLERGAAVPVQMTYSSQHLASWTSSTWWSSHKSTVVRHWISIYGYSGFWDGTYGPQLFLTDSSGGYGGRTGSFQNATRLVYNLNQANSRRIVY